LRVAQLKTISLPKLELYAALLLTRMTNSLVPKLNLNITKKYFWSDSKILLSLIASSFTNWEIFVTHHVGEIQDTTSTNEWSHVRTEENQTDKISRGCDASQLADIALWWKGPRWFKKNEKEWPLIEKYDTQDSIQNSPEAKSIQLFTCAITDDFLWFKKFYLLNKIICITAYCLRFRDFLVKKNSDAISPLKVEDLERPNIALKKKYSK